MFLEVIPLELRIQTVERTLDPCAYWGELIGSVYSSNTDKKFNKKKIECEQRDRKQQQQQQNEPYETTVKSKVWNTMPNEWEQYLSMVLKNDNFQHVCVCDSLKCDRRRHRHRRCGRQRCCSVCIVFVIIPLTDSIQHRHVNSLFFVCDFI